MSIWFIARSGSLEAYTDVIPSACLARRTRRGWRKTRLHRHDGRPRGIPHPLGTGRYFDTTLMLGLGWRVAPTGSLSVRTEILAGGLYLAGTGYDINYDQWLPWVGTRISVSWRFRYLSLGLELGASPLQHTVSTDTGEKRALPWLTVGLVLGLPLFSIDLK